MVTQLRIFRYIAVSLVILIYYMNRFKNKTRLEEVKMLMQGLTVPEPPVVSRDAQLPAQQLPRTPPQPVNLTETPPSLISIEEPVAEVSVPTSRK